MGFNVVSADSSLNCHGDGNGTIDITGTGGTQPYTYHWNTGASGATINSLSGGIYTDTITDHNGCKILHTVSITTPALIPTIQNVTNVSCHGQHNGSATVSVTGGTPGYNINGNPGKILLL